MTDTKNNLTISLGRILTVLLTFITALCLLVYAGPVGDGVRLGLRISADALIPSLFPFLVFAAFLTRTRAGELLSRPFGFLAKYLLRLPENMASVVLMSFIGGFPVGARMLSGLLENGQIKESRVSRMLCYCVNSGPSFLITAVGLSMYGYSSVGVLLLVTQLLSSLIMGFVLSFTSTPEKPGGPAPRYQKPYAALVDSVGAGLSGMLSICAFVVFFSALIALLSHTGLLREVSIFLCDVLPFDLPFGFYESLLTGLLEVTSGCISAAALGGRTGFLLTAFLVSFGSLSIIFQVISSFSGSDVNFVPFIISRFAGGFLSVIIALPLYNRFLATLDVSLGAGPAPGGIYAHSAAVSFCMIAMCTILLMAVSAGAEEPRKQ